MHWLGVRETEGRGLGIGGCYGLIVSPKSHSLQF